ncbi:MAG: hypothetical protein MHM6MM_004600 [Cercozoa sp. M6MM]
MMVTTSPSMALSDGRPCFVDRCTAADVTVTTASISRKNQRPFHRLRPSVAKLHPLAPGAIGALLLRLQRLASVRQRLAQAP